MNQATVADRPHKQLSPMQAMLVKFEEIDDYTGKVDPALKTYEYA